MFYKKSKIYYKGLSILSAIFITTVMSLSAYFIVNITNETNASINIVLQGTRAYYAAKSGVEWGLTTATINGACPDSTTIILNQAGLKNFSVYITCISQIDGKYQITAQATYGTFGNFGYVIRTATGSNH